ncbi:OmpW/AlkL family protein [Pseudoduganella violacea]|uniref:Outer membrane protein n=1 Tax=Pseudoduganella violacea TaxID=1715466 RepID=A0A7W5BB21_9BURK|nr:OmpW family outer membrane protein [Pseudoduganella violacea]MBB3119703.1 outer membrane protein [Pseudoduganella violacea]
MKKTMNRAAHVLAQAAVLSVALGAASTASAQSAGDWILKVGVNRITPKVESGNVSAPALPESKADVAADTKPIFNITRMLTDNISAELDLGVPYKHDLLAAGSIAGSGKLGTSEVLPPTALIQYRFFEPNARLRPYVGLGLTYAYFQKERGSAQLTALLNTGGPGTTFSLKSKFAASFQIGASLRIDDRWGADIGIIKTKLKTTASFSTGQTMEARLDPLAVSLGVTYKF